MFYSLHRTWYAAHTYAHRLSFRKLQLFLILLSLTLLGSNFSLQAQLQCNTPTPLTVGYFSSTSLSTDGNGINRGNLIDTNMSNHAPLASLLTIPGWCSVEYTADTFPRGTYAGAVIEQGALSALSGVRITTFNGSTQQESQVLSTNLVSLLGGSNNEVVGFKTSLPFNKIEIRLNSLVGSLDVYYFFVEKPCPGDSLVCNTLTPLVKPNFPVNISSANTSIGSLLCIGCTLNNITNVIDSNTNNAASITLPVSLGAMAKVSIKSEETYAAGHFVGFDISSTDFLSLNLIDNITVETYVSDTATGDVYSGSDLLGVATNLLQNNGRRIVGFETTKAFDEVVFRFTNLLGANLSAMYIHNAVIQKFCSRPLTHFNYLEPLTNPEYPVFINAKETEVNAAVCAACSITDPLNIIDSDKTNAATVDLSLGLLAEATVAVGNALDTYAAHTFAGFDIETASFLSASVLGTIRIDLLRDNTVVTSSTNNNLLVGAQTALLNGRTRQILGIVSEAPFDEARISFTEVLNVDLGEIKIYGFYAEPSTQVPLACNTSYTLKSPQFPAVINADRSGVDGAVSAATTTTDIWNVTQDTNEPAIIENTASVLATNRISVQVPNNKFPPNTMAGFTIGTDKSYVLDLDLLSSLTIKTYYKGVQQESKSGADILSLSLLRIINLFTTPYSNIYTVGFKVTDTFDEIVLETATLASVTALNGQMEVYSAFVDTRYLTSASTTGNCITLLPDFNVGMIGETISGDVSTNDQLLPDMVYGTPIPDNNNPSGATLTMANDGSYTFLATDTGKFSYQVPVGYGVDDIVEYSELDITIIETTTGFTNRPIINPDIISLQKGESISINVLLNDKVATPGAQIDKSTLKATDKDGNVISSTAKGGTLQVSTISGYITYQPDTSFVGIDTFYYTVCDNQPTPMCGQSFVVAYVLPNDVVVNDLFASDDLVLLTSGDTVTSNILTNDTDPNGDNIFATPQSISNTGLTYDLLTTGDLTVGSGNSYSGSSFFINEVYDDNSSPVTRQSTTYVVVTPENFILPVQLKSINVITNACRNMVQWTTGTETDVKGFVIEQSIDGKNWMVIGTVEPKGTNAQYAFEHTNPAAINYYRLQVLNTDLSKQYSKVVEVRVNCVLPTNVNVYPTSTTDNITVEQVGISQIIKLTVQDLYGHKLFEHTTESTKTKVSLSNFTQGQYILILEMDGTKYNTLIQKL